MNNIWSRLNKLGIVGQNSRNHEIILRYNKRKLYPLVDDKLKTKKLATAAGISVPDLYAVIENQPQAERFVSERNHPDFVIKPSRGSGGEGIIVVTGTAKSGFRKADGSIISFNQVVDHLTRILGGVYSLGGQTDKALVEYRVRFDPVFQEVSYLGVPDVRIIVFLGFPIAAMLRLPTRRSSGKANLHQGAVGVGIAVPTGHSTYGVCQSELVDEHPDTGAPLNNIQVPTWDKFLALSSQAYELTGLGYQGVDLVLDEQRGPLLLELNARPGLAIQVANRFGLMDRIRKVERDRDPSWTPEQRVEKVKEWFK